jgi:hypothetical protein
MGRCVESNQSGAAQGPLDEEEEEDETSPDEDGDDERARAGQGPLEEDEMSPDEDGDDERARAGGPGQRERSDDLPVPDLPPLDTSDPTASLPHSMAIPDSAWRSLSSVDETQVVGIERRLLEFSTARTFTTSQRAMLDHCITATAEATADAPEDVRARWYALLHLLPRMLCTTASLRRAKASAPRPFWRRNRTQRHRRASTDHVDAVFRDRCHAFMTGNWAPLLAVPAAARRILHEADDDRLARDVLALVHAGELSRAMARADALALASPTASTIEALRTLHPPDDHSLSPHAPLFCPVDLEALAPSPRADGVEPERLRDSALHEVLFRKLPRCSAADHAGWRYEYFASTYRYLSTTLPDQPPGSPAAFVPGRGALALKRLCSDLFSGAMPASVRPWFLGGRLIA